MGNKIIFSLVMVFVVVSMFGFVGAKRDLVPYGNVLVESSVLNALMVETQSYVLVSIEINQSLNLNIEITKSQILSDLTESELSTITNLKDSEWFSGRLTIEGLEKLKNRVDIIKITEIGWGSTAEESDDGGEESNLLWFWIVIVIVLITMVLYFLLKERNIK